MTQRRLYKRGELREDRKSRLNDIGFPWDKVGPREAKWHSQFQKMIGILEEQKAVGEEDKAYWPSVLGVPLYGWVRRQRVAHETGRIDPKRKALLDGIDFVWSSKK